MDVNDTIEIKGREFTITDKSAMGPRTAELTSGRFDGFNYSLEGKRGAIKGAVDTIV